MRDAFEGCVWSPLAAWRGWQMLGAFLEAVSQEQGLLMCPLMGHMAGHCRRCVHLLPSCHKPCSKMLTSSQPLLQRFVTCSVLVSEIVALKKKEHI